MASVSTPPHLPALGTSEREEIGRELQVCLVGLIDLALIGKQLHWTVVGPLFRPLHLYLDELVESWHELGDSVAERAVALGFIPDGQARTVASESELAPVDRALLDTGVVVHELVRRIAEVSETVRGRMDRLGELDLASQDVLIEVVRSLEEQQWMLRAQVAGRS
jgi:starvation-inducible DNA-binding protein